MPAAASEPPTVVVVFDGSGSMWGKLDGERQSKLVMARDALRAGLEGVPPTTRVGVMSFGHRRGGDCQDTETLLPPAALDVERVLGPLERLNPRGRGPLTKALREAAASLGPASAPASVLVVHDGPDNCQLDPCSAIPDLRRAHPKVRIDVVSLGLDADEAQTVACLAKETGGRHHVVDTAVATREAMLAAFRLAPSADVAAAAGAERRPPGAAAPLAAVMPVPTGKPGLLLTAQLVPGGPAVALPVHWQVRRAGETGPPLWEGTLAAPLLALPTGRYDIVARSGLVVRTATAEAVEGQFRALQVTLDAGTLALAVAPEGVATLQEAIVTLTRLDARGPAEPEILRRVEGEIAVPPGNYLFALTDGALRIERPIGIEIGTRLSLADAVALGRLELAAVAAVGGAKLEQVAFVVYEDDPDATSGRREVARTAGAAPRLRLPAGSYVVVARHGTAEARERVLVRAGGTERRTIVLEAARVAVTVRAAAGAGDDPILHRLERLEGPPDLLRASGPDAKFDVAAGQWRLETRVGLANVRYARDLRLKAGETETVTLDAKAGALRMRLTEGGSRTRVPDVIWELREPSGAIVWSGFGTEPRHLLLPGRYVVKAIARGVATERTVEVRAGEQREVELSRP
jgi:Ca-activated chloride channel family protein